jgi:phosphonopyruvate decarboxylase
MIEVSSFLELLRCEGINFFAGVPDSILKPFCTFLCDRVSPPRHVIAANEGSAVALAAGHYLATGYPGVVYLQNSGLGNAVNPLVSLAGENVYGIPLLLVIGWRGQPGTKDEPQHRLQGEVTRSLLELIGIPCEVLPRDEDSCRATVRRACEYLVEREAPFALLVQRGTFADSDSRTALRGNGAALTRESAIRQLAAAFDPRDVVIATTGMTGRELMLLRRESGGSRPGDFQNVGAMGHASQIALGIALAQPTRQVYCLDGDGALLMHLGGLATIGQQSPPNLKHVVLNNGVHDSVGGHPTAMPGVDLTKLASALGYRWCGRAATAGELGRMICHAQQAVGPLLLEVCVVPGTRHDLPRPEFPLAHYKRTFQQFLAP